MVSSKRFRQAGILHRVALAAVLLPSLAAAQQDASQASYLEYRQCLASALQVSGRPAASADLAMAQARCASQRARLSADIYQDLRAEGRPESMSRRIASNAVETLEARIRDQRSGGSQDAP